MEEVVITILISVMAEMIVYYLCKWLDRKKIVISQSIEKGATSTCSLFLVHGYHNNDTLLLYPIFLI